jgi:hypothetical protein
MTPNAEGVISSVATESGLGFATGVSNAQPIILGGCDG